MPIVWPSLRTVSPASISTSAILCRAGTAVRTLSDVPPYETTSPAASGCIAIPTLSTVSSRTKSGDADDAGSEATPRAVPLSSQASVAFPIGERSVLLRQSRQARDYRLRLFENRVSHVRSGSPTTTFGFRMGASRQSERNGIAFAFGPL